MFRRFVFGLTLVLSLSPVMALACPFCSAVSLTFTQEMKASDAAVLAELVELPKTASETEGPPGLGDALAKAKFRVVEILKGAEHLKGVKEVEAIYFGDAPIGSQFVIMGIDPASIAWSTPIAMSKRGREYIAQVMKLPESGADRLAFFQQYLEDEEEMLARDSHDEFAIAAYEDVKGLAPRMNREKLIQWITHPETAPSRRRLYLTMLGVCGAKDDVGLLESLLRSDDRKLKSGGLDAMIGCYLALKGPEGLTLVDELFLNNSKAEFIDTNAAIRSIRISQDAGIISKESAAAALRHVLKNPQLADLVIPDLARWQDWSVMDRLEELFVNASDETSWVRVPVLRYFAVCPLPEAKERLAKLEKIDPEAAKRAKSFLPLTGAPAPGDKSSPQGSSGADPQAASGKSPSETP